MFVFFSAIPDQGVDGLVLLQHAFGEDGVSPAVFGGTGRKGVAARGAARLLWSGARPLLGHLDTRHVDGGLPDVDASGERFRHGVEQGHRRVELTAIPYYAWANRGLSRMNTYLYQVE